MKWLFAVMFLIVAVSCKPNQERWCGNGEWAKEQCCLVCLKAGAHGYGWSINYNKDLTVGCFCDNGKATTLKPEVIQPEKE